MTRNPQFEVLAAKARRVHDAVTAVRGRAESAGGHVTVEVDAAGHITSLTITDAALTGDATVLAATVAATHRAALTEAANTAQALRDELTTDPVAVRVIAALESNTPARPQPRPVEENDDAFHATG